MYLESAMRNLLGGTYYGYAGAFSSPKLCRKVLLRAIKRIRRRIDEIALTDERLLLTTSIALERIESDVKSMSSKVNNDWLIIGNLLYLVSLLLGYDWEEGRVHRHVIFYQERTQEIEDYSKRVGQKFWDEFPKGDWRIRYEIVYLLRKRKLPINQIARITNMSDKLVTKIIKRIDDFEKNTGKDFLKESDKLAFNFFLA